MAGIGPTDLDDACQALLAVAVTTLDTIPTFDPALLGSPAKSFVSPGVPVWDCCEMLVVHVAGIAQQFTRPTSPPAAVGMRHKYGAWLWEAALVLTLGRCIPEGELVGKTYNPPTATELDAAAAQINADGWALANGIANALNEGELHEKCSGWKWDGVNAATPMGGCGGWTINFRVTVDGYGADPGS